MRYQFSTTQSNGQTEGAFLEGIVPILTKMGHFQMVETEDAPGHVDILTMERQYVGSYDIRGMVDAFGIQQSHAILIHIWVEHNKRQGSNCNVMLISPHQFLAGDQNQ